MAKNAEDTPAPKKELFDLALTPDSGSAARSAGTFLTSLAIQGGILAGMVIVPLLATDNLPTPEGIMTFMAPPPPPPKARPRPTAPRPVLAATPQFVAPVEIPDDIGMDDVGVDFGVPGGVEGGVPGGVIGGIVGGLPDAPPPPKKQEPVRVGGDIRPPNKIKDAAPSYPEIAKQARVQGIVILEAIIDPAGNVTNVRVLRSIPLLDQSAINAVKQWKYEPTMLNGVPVPIVMTVTVNFALS